MLVLDDPFSALDKTVVEHIVDRLLGPKGLFKATKAGVFLLTNSGESISISGISLF